MIISNKTKKKRDENECNLEKDPQKKVKTIDNKFEKFPTFFGNFLPSQNTQQQNAQDLELYQQEVKTFKTQAKEIFKESLRQKIQEYKRLQSSIEEEFQEIKKQSEQQEAEVNEIFGMNENKQSILQVDQKSEIEKNKTIPETKPDLFQLFPHSKQKQTQTTSFQNERKIQEDNSAPSFNLSQIDPQATQKATLQIFQCSDSQSTQHSSLLNTALNQQPIFKKKEEVQILKQNPLCQKKEISEDSLKGQMSLFQKKSISIPASQADMTKQLGSLEEINCKPPNISTQNELKPNITKENQTSIQGLVQITQNQKLEKSDVITQNQKFETKSDEFISLASVKNYQQSVEILTNSNGFCGLFQQQNQDQQNDSKEPKRNLGITLQTSAKTDLPGPKTDNKKDTTITQECEKPTSMPFGQLKASQEVSKVDFLTQQNTQEPGKFNKGLFGQLGSQVNIKTDQEPEKNRADQQILNKQNLTNDLNKQNQLLSQNQHLTESFGILQPQSKQDESQNKQKQTGVGQFGQSQQQDQQKQTSGGLFGQQQDQQKQTSAGLFEQSKQTNGGLFGQSSLQNQQKQMSGGIFGQSQQQDQQKQKGVLIQQQDQSKQPSAGIFGFFQQQDESKQTSGGIFAQFQQQDLSKQTSVGLFGSSQQQDQQKQTSGGLFGQSLLQNQQKQKSEGLFAQQQDESKQTMKGMFGQTQQQDQQKQIIGGMQDQQKQTNAGELGQSENKTPPAISGLFQSVKKEENNLNANVERTIQNINPQDKTQEIAFKTSEPQVKSSIGLFSNILQAQQQPQPNISLFGSQQPTSIQTQNQPQQTGIFSMNQNNVISDNKAGLFQLPNQNTNQNLQDTYAQGPSLFPPVKSSISFFNNTSQQTTTIPPKPEQQQNPNQNIMGGIFQQTPQSSQNSSFSLFNSAQQQSSQGLFANLGGSQQSQNTLFGNLQKQ